MGGSGTELQGPRCKAQSVPGRSRSVGVGAPRCLHCSQLLTGGRDPPHCPHCPPQHCPQANSKWPGPVPALLRDVSTETRAAAFQCPLARASGAPGQWCKGTTLQGGWGVGCAGDAVDQLSPLLWGACFALRKASPPSSTLSKAGVWEKQSGSRYPRASRPQESSWPA